MLFKPELVRLILRGKKTGTRRKVEPGGTGCRYKVGRTYAVTSARFGCLRRELLAHLRAGKGIGKGQTPVSRTICAQIKGRAVP